jgi:heptosyltransferase-1
VDGGIVHTAVAMGRPTLALFGPTDPAIWFPYEDLGPFRVLCTRPACHPCNRHTCTEFICLPELGVDLVAEAASEMLAETGRTG